MPWVPQRFLEGCLEIWVLGVAIIHHFCSLISLLDIVVPCTRAGRGKARRGPPGASLLGEIAHYSCCEFQYLPRSLCKHWFMRAWMQTDSLWLGIPLSCREFTPDQQKIISETPLVISFREAAFCREDAVPKRTGGSVHLFLLSHRSQRKHSTGPAGRSPLHISGSDHVCKTAHFYQPHVLKFCPSVSHCGLSAARGYGGCRCFPSAFFHLFLLCMITFGIVSAQYVCMCFLFAFLYMTRI